MMSAKGSPGVTTTALALAMTWPRDVLLVEADPAGGDIMAGYVRAELASDRGLAHLAISARHDRLAEELAAQVIDLAPKGGGTSRLLVPGLTDPAQAPGVDQAWPRLARFFAELAGPRAKVPRDTILDCGRLTVPYPPVAAFREADVLLLVVRTNLRSASAAAPIVETIRRGLTHQGGDPDRLGLLLIEAGEYRPGDMSRGLGAPVVASMPWRDREATTLSDGLGRLGAGSTLLRSARSAGEAIMASVVRGGNGALRGAPPPWMSPLPATDAAGRVPVGAPHSEAGR